MLSPVLAIFLMISFTPLISFSLGALSTRYRLFMILMLLRLNVYPLMGSGWASNRKYALLGGLRAAAQTISYEISLAFIILRITILWGRIRLISFLGHRGLLGFILPGVFILLPWLVTVIAELNRTPFDFAEGESELVSGFNIEYGSEKFAIIFLAEYGIIYVFSLLTSYIFLNASAVSIGARALLGIVVGFYIIWLRATLPRFRYDLLILLCWKTLFPRSLGLCQAAVLVFVFM